MSNEQTYSLWLRPFGDIAHSLRERIKKLSEKYNTPIFEPHVTLLGGLQHGETELTQLTDTLAGALHPFDVVLTRAGFGDTFYQSIFVHAQKTSELVDARSTAEKLFGTPSEKFNPHLSLLYGDISKNDKERILNIMGREFHIRFPVHNLLLVNTTGKPGQWKHIHSSEFSKAK